MRIANILIVYKYPELVHRVIKAMEHADFDFYIHVDKKVDERPFRELMKDMKGVYFIKKRIVVRWAGFSFTKSLINSIGEIISSGRKYQFINNISGQDYPVKSPEYIYDFFNNNIGKSFLSSESIHSEWWDHAQGRFNRYHMTDFGFRGRHRLAGFLNFILPKRKFPLPFVLYGGPCASYWSLSIDAATYLFNFISENKRLQFFFKFTWAPDEFLVNTIIMNSYLKDTVINNNYRYIDWTLGGARPKILTVGDLSALKKSDKLIARKFDTLVDQDILGLIDEEILLN